MQIGDLEVDQLDECADVKAADKKEPALGRLNSRYGGNSVQVLGFTHFEKTSRNSR